MDELGEKFLTDELRNKIKEVVAYFLYSPYHDNAQDWINEAILEGFNFRGLNNLSDKELLYEFKSLVIGFKKIDLDKLNDEVINNTEGLLTKVLLNRIDNKAFKKVQARRRKVKTKSEEPEPPVC